MLEVVDKKIGDEPSRQQLTSPSQELSIVVGSVGDDEVSNKTSISACSRENKQEEEKEEIVAKETVLEGSLLNEDDTNALDSKLSLLEPHKSCRFVNLQKLNTEIPNPRTRVIHVKEYCPQEKESTEDKQGERENEMPEKDERPLKSLHWSALRRPMAEYAQRHRCKGSTWACEKCRHIYKVKKTSERFQTLRAAKEALLKEDSSEGKEKEANEEQEMASTEEKEENGEKLVKASVPNARTVALKAKKVVLGNYGCSVEGGNSKWALTVLGGFRKDLDSEQDKDENVLLPDFQHEIERGLEQNTVGRVFRLKFWRDFLDDEPDEESEYITYQDLTSRYQGNAMFIPPCVCEPRVGLPRPVTPRMRIFDMGMSEPSELSVLALSNRILKKYEVKILAKEL